MLRAHTEIVGTKRLNPKLMITTRIHHGPAQSSYKTPRQVAEQVLGEIDWHSPTKGYLPCPGAERHSTPDGLRDCCVFLDGAPTVYCVHSSCLDEIKEMTARLRMSMRAEFVRDGPDPVCVSGSFVRSKVQPALAVEAEGHLAKIVSSFAWPLESLRSSSPTAIPVHPDLHYHEYLKLFGPKDVIWIGDIYDSGQPSHGIHFHSASEWAGRAQACRPLVCPATFQHGVCSRSNENVYSRPFLVVESDHIDPEVERKLAAKLPLTAEDKQRNKLGCAAIFSWLRESVGMQLRAVVDTGNKSLHGHFDMPHPDVFAELEVILPALKCDRALFKPSQPVRLPGWLRDGEYQKLLFLDLSSQKAQSSQLPSQCFGRL